MADVVVTVPKGLWLDWIEEGALPGQEWDGESEFHFFGRGSRPNIKIGERVYVVAHGMLRGYAPLVAIDYVRYGQMIRCTEGGRLFDYEESEPHPLPDWWWPGATYGLVRHAGAVAVTISQPIRGFQGWRYCWWDRAAEDAFPDWQTRGVA